MKHKWIILRFILKKVHQIFPFFMPLLMIQAMFQIAFILIDVYFISFILDVISSSSIMEEAFLKIFIILFIIFSLKMIIVLLNKYIGIKIEIINEYIMCEIDEVLTNIEYEKIEDPKFMELVSKIISPIIDYDSIFELLSITPSFIQHGLTIVSLIIVLLNNDYILLCFVLILFVINACYQYHNMKKETASLQERMTLNKQYWYYLRELKNPDIAKDVRVYSLQSFLLNKIDSLLHSFFIHNKKISKLKNRREILNTSMSILLMLGTYGLLLTYGYQKGFTPAKLMLMISATTALFASFQAFQTTVLSCNKQIVLLSDYVTFADISKVHASTDSIVLSDPISSIAFVNVSFHYPNTEEMVLHHMNLKIEGKQWISIVGNNGSGKTTMMKLLTRLYKPVEGNILVNGIDINLYEYTSYIKQVSIIFQDFRTFQYTLKENIVFKNNDENKLQEVIQKTDLANVVEILPKDVNTAIGRSFDESGVYLSKGQEQKLAIARSIYKNGSMLILDEPTAALDPLAEEEIFHQFREITKDNISITISHRLSSCQFSDYIIVLDHGEVKENGTHSELMKLQGLYATMFNLQKSNYVNISNEQHFELVEAEK